MQRFTLLNVCGSVTYISWSSDSVLYLEDYLMAECCTGDIDSVWQENWPEAIYVGQRPTFHSPVILSCILKTIWWTNVKMGILDPCDAKIYCIKYMWVSDLHIMVQWFCPFWWRNVVLKILIQWDTNLYLQINVQVSDLYFVILPYILNTIWWISPFLWILVVW